MGNDLLLKSTIIEGVATTPDRDVQKEILDLHGADITPLLEKRGFVNSDHKGDFSHLCGRVLEAKKISALSDCETSSQIKYWDEKRKPFLWTRMELWDGVGHKEADSIASIYKFYKDKNEEPPIKISVEGKTLEKGPNGVLKRTLIKGLALTVHPANRNTRTEVVGLVKNAGGHESLVKHEDDVVPFFIERPTDYLERIYSLALTARDLLKSIPEQRFSEDPLAKCKDALETLRNLKRRINHNGIS